MPSLKTNLSLGLSLALSMGLAAAADEAAPKKEKPKSFKPVAVTAVKAATAPTLDGDAGDAVWKSAPVLNLKAVKGVNFEVKSYSCWKNGDGMRWVLGPARSVAGTRCATRCSVPRSV